MVTGRIPRAGTYVQAAQEEQEFACSIQGKEDYDFYFIAAGCRRDTYDRYCWVPFNYTASKICTGSSLLFLYATYCVRELLLVFYSLWIWNAGLGFVHFLMNQDAPHRTKAIWVSSQRRIFLWKCKQELQMAFPDPDQLKITGIHQPTVNTANHSCKTNSCKFKHKQQATLFRLIFLK